MADVNGDGKSDIVVVDSENGQVNVLLGNGDGTFKPPTSFALDSYPSAVSVADLNGDGRQDLVTSTGTVLLGNSDGSFTGQTYTIVPLLDIVPGATGFERVDLTEDPDGQHIDWTLDQTTAQVFINDPNGLTINSNGSMGFIALHYTNGDPFPNLLHVNGTFTVASAQGTNPLAGTTLDIGRSTVYISYATPGADPIAAIKSYLRSGYNNGAWNGTPAPGSGVITSLAAASNPNHNTAIGFADGADGQGVEKDSETIQLTYTLYGDANLDHQVNSADLQILLFGLNRPGSWDQGDFNYDGQVNSADLQSLLFTLNASLGNQAGGTGGGELRRGGAQNQDNSHGTSAAADADRLDQTRAHGSYPKLLIACDGLSFQAASMTGKDQEIRPQISQVPQIKERPICVICVI